MSTSDETTEKLNVTLAELHTAEAALRAQNDQLIAAHETILAERQRYHELFNFAPDGYLVTDPSGIIQEVNLAAAQLLGRSRRYLPGKPLRVFIHPPDRPTLDRLLTHLGAGEAITGAEFRLELADGRTVPVAVHANATGLSDGRVTGFRWIVHDLRELKAAQERMTQAERLAAVGQTVAAIAHESRTALQRAQACIRILRLEVADRPAALDLADRAGKAVEDMAHIVETVRAVVSRPHLRTRRCDLREIWREAWAAVVDSGRAGTLDEPARLWDPTILGDPFRLSQVFTNLFDNALAAGAQTVSVAGADAELDGRPAVRVTVRDDGPGLDAEQRRRVFEPFYSTRPDGMGLGMAIVQNVVEAHGGRVAAADREPPGAEIHITLLRDPS